MSPSCPHCTGQVGKPEPPGAFLQAGFLQAAEIPEPSQLLSPSSERQHVPPGGHGEFAEARTAEAE